MSKGDNCNFAYPYQYIDTCTGTYFYLYSIKAARVLYSTPILSYLIETVRFYSTLFYITLLYTVLNH